jgi:hypothetical protein
LHFFKSLDFNGYGYLLAIEKKFQHGKELAKSLDLLPEIDGIVCISADQVLVEVCSIPMETDYEICYASHFLLITKGQNIILEKH